MTEQPTTEPPSLYELNLQIRNIISAGLPQVLEQLFVAATQSKNLQAKVTAIRALLALAKETGAIEADPMKLLMTEMAEGVTKEREQELALPKSLTKS